MNSAIEYEHSITRNKYGGCDGCGVKWKRGSIRHRWRMNLLHNQVYLSGGFWTSNCDKCFKDNVKSIAETFTEINNLRKKEVNK